MKREDRSLGSRLKERRLFLEISLEELSAKSGVACKYLRRIEKEQWDLLPGGVYTKGILRRYAVSVGEDPERVAREFEKGINTAIPEDKKSSRKFFETIDFSPRFFRLLAAAVVLLALVGYIVYQLSPVFARPELAIDAPASDEVVVREDNLVLIGRTEPGTSLFLNGQLLSLNETGRFEIPVELLPGLNVLEVKAVSRFGKETVRELKVIFTE